MPATLTAEQLEALRQIDSPTIANAIEIFDVRPRYEGFCGPEIECRFPEMEPVVGYAVTVEVANVKTVEEKLLANQYEFFRALDNSPKPAICVFKDVSPEGARRASQWGEMYTTAAKHLGAVAVVTDGAIRDLNEIREVGDFQYFAPAICVSHGILNTVSIGKPVEIGGCVIEPGDLLHGDLNGVVKIPLDIADRVIDGVKQVREEEGASLKQLHPGMTLEELKEAFHY
jgi:4-hydroxy-4-methyl-2-oxoglutarate aldolase